MVADLIRRVDCYNRRVVDDDGEWGETGPVGAPVMMILPTSLVAERLASLAASFAMANTMEDLGCCAQEAIESFIGAEYNGLYLWDAELRGLRLLYSVGFTEEERVEAERTALDRHPGAVFRSGEVLHIEDVYEDRSGQSRSSARSFEVRSRLFVPVTFRDEVLGVFGLASPLPRRFSGQDVAILRFICRLAGVVHRRLLDNQEHAEAQALIQSALERANGDLLGTQAELLAANQDLEARVAERTRDLEAKNLSLAEALATIERTQEQVVQAEKLASLGLLVAGIAHEIKNPLNFVINFAELSTELVADADEVVGGGDPGGDEVRALLGEIGENLERIREHGQRANETINAMLMHAREHGGELVACDLNSIVHEHALLAYHGFRATARGFVAEIETDFDAGLTRVQLPLQEVSRVLLNLVTNACHALRERSLAAEPGYAPKIRLTTEATDAAIIVRVRDNGTGIIPEVRRRLFVPFFTTKRAGEGTGLGLSMSYDIVVKQLGGRLLVDSEVGVYSEFTVEIPRGRQSGEEP